MVKSENIILQTAYQTVKIEMETLRELLESLDDSFTACIERIFECKGRLILTGVGKSALVAQKIVATLNSTGTPALFMHAADAIHGDLGMITPEDIVMCLSKSGETSEIKVLVPLVKNLGNLLVAMVSRANCFLAKNADYVLYLPVTKEADPNNLAPTASTTAQMAMGDAIATSLLALRGFTSSDFAQFHPGGSLGKQLYLRARDIYKVNDRPQVIDIDTLDTIILEMTAKRLGATAVLNKNKALVGIITDGDLRRMLKEGMNTNNVTAREIMSSNPITIKENELAINVLHTIRQKNITQIIVVDDSDNYLGMIHFHDLIKEGLV